MEALEHVPALVWSPFTPSLSLSLSVLNRTMTILQPAVEDSFLLSWKISSGIFLWFFPPIFASAVDEESQATERSNFGPLSGRPTGLLLIRPRERPRNSSRFARYVYVICIIVVVVGTLRIRRVVLTQLQGRWVGGRASNEWVSMVSSPECCPSIICEPGRWVKGCFCP